MHKIICFFLFWLDEKNWIQEAPYVNELKNILIIKTSYSSIFQHLLKHKLPLIQSECIHRNAFELKLQLLDVIYAALLFNDFFLFSISKSLKRGFPLFIRLLLHWCSDINITWEIHYSDDYRKIWRDVDDAKWWSINRFPKSRMSSSSSITVTNLPSTQSKPQKPHKIFVFKNPQLTWNLLHHLNGFECLFFWSLTFLEWMKIQAKANNWFATSWSQSNSSNFIQRFYDYYSDELMFTIDFCISFNKHRSYKYLIKTTSMFCMMDQRWLNDFTANILNMIQSINIDDDWMETRLNKILCAKFKLETFYCDIIKVFKQNA